MNQIIRILMSRDDYSREDAEEIFRDLYERSLDGEDPEELLYEIGLEPDYVFDLLESFVDVDDFSEE